jgi:conjugative transposon TraM protein
MLNDPFYKNGLDTMALPVNVLKPAYEGKLNASPYYPSGRTDPTEAKIYERIDALNKAIEPSQVQSARPGDTHSLHKASDGFSSDVDRLENMMNAMKGKDAGGDPQMNQLGSMLDKILDIQHPERMKERIRERSIKNKETAFAVGRNPTSANVSLLDTSGKGALEQTGFYGIDQEELANEQSAIEAVVHESQTLLNGAVVKLRLLNDIYIGGKLIPKESFVFGIASLSGERLQVEVSSIRNGNSLFAVKLEVYDMDGLPGIYIPGAITRDVAKQSADNSLQLMDIGTMDPSLKAQAAAAGINAGKNLLSKKARLTKVMVKAGYKVLLMDKKS